MVFRITLIAVLMLLSFWVASPTAAQQSAQPMLRRAPLGERLQRFRQGLTSDAPRSGGRVPASQQRQRRPRRPGVAQPGVAPPEVEQGELAAPPAAVGHGPAVAVPSYLQKQKARPARGGSPRPAPPVDGATRSLRAKMGTFNRSFDRSLPRDAGPQPSPHQASPGAIDDEAVVVPVEPELTEATSQDVSREELPQPQPTPADLIGQEPTPAEPVTLEPTLAEPPNSAATELDQPQEYAAEDAEPAPEPTVREPRVARAGREAISPAPQEPQDSVLVEDAPTARAFDEPAQTIDESVQKTDDSRQPLASPADSFDQPTQPTDQPVESIGEPARSFAETNEPAKDPQSSDVLFTSQSPVLSVEASGPRTVMIGKEARFVVKVRNSGAAANNVVVRVKIPGYIDVAGAQPTAGTAQRATGDEQAEGLDWMIDRLEAGSEETLSLSLVPRKSSPLDLAVNWTFTPETSQTMVEVREPKLALSLSGPLEVLYGQTKVYKLTISNPGNGDTENVTVGLLPIGRSGEAPANHRLGTLAAGESKTIDIELTARQAGALTIKAHAFADGGLRAEAGEQVLVRRASLQVEVEAPRIKYAGTQAKFRVKVENVGDAAAENVQVSAILPPESKFTSASSGGRLGAQQAQVNWGVGSLQPGGQRVFELQCSLGAAGDNRLQFTAAADGDLSAAATATTRVEAIADLKLEVRDPQGPIAVGDEAVYEVRIHNRGTKAAEGVDLAIFFSEGLEATAADGGPHDIGTGQVIFQPIASLAAGDTAVLHIHTRSDASGNHVFRAEVSCESLGTKLATEEATHFYGEPRTAVVRKGEPRVATRPAEPTPAAPQREWPTPAAPPYKESSSDEPPSE